MDAVAPLHRPGRAGVTGAARPDPADPPPGLCEDCRHARRNTTRRGTTYLRCGRAAWDDRLVRYPRLPVLSCVGVDRF